MGSHELYERLEEETVLAASGYYFFPGLDDSEWNHVRECVRIIFFEDESDFV